MQYFSAKDTVGVIQKIASWFVARRKAHQDELNAIARVFGPFEELAGWYVEPDCQNLNPVDNDPTGSSDFIGFVARTSVFRALDEFFHKPPRRESDGTNHLFLLADAGMGKTSLLLELRLAALAKIWPREHKCELFKLGDGTLDEIRTVADPQRTHLLLDSLDEDRMAFGRAKDRVLEILDATKTFRKVIITCRTQFFEVDAEIEQRSAVRIGPYICPALYLSPFDDDQVDRYIGRRFPPSVWQRIGVGRAGIQPRAREIADFMGNLRARPLLLSYIDDIIEGSEIGEIDHEFGLYRVVVWQWLRREERKARERGDSHVTAERLFYGVTELAVEAQEQGTREIAFERIENLSKKLSEVEEVGRIPLEGRSLINRTASGGYRFAHYSFQEYLVANALRFNAKLFQRVRLHWTELLSVFFRQALGEIGVTTALSGPALSQVSLAGASLARMNLTEATLDGLVLDGADLRWATLTLASLEGTNLRRANLTEATLLASNLTGADLSEAILVDVNANGAKLRGAKATRANLRGAQLSDADLREADLERALFATTVKVDAGGGSRRTSLKRANLSDARLLEANLSRTTLAGAVLARAVLSGANLMAADLKDADLSNADLTNANLERADLSGARLSGANLRGATLRGATLSSADLSEANLTDVGFDDVDLRWAKVQGAKIEGTSALFWERYLLGRPIGMPPRELKTDFGGTNALVHRAATSTEEEEGADVPPKKRRP